MSMFHELMMRKKEQIMYATIKGTLTENDGVFSGFSDSNYLELQQPFKVNQDTIAEIEFKVNFSSLDTYTSNIIVGYPNSYDIQINCIGTQPKLHLFIGNGNSWNLLNNISGITTISVNTDYFVKLVFNKNNVKLLLSTDNINWTTEIDENITLTEEYIYNLCIGKGRSSNQYLLGSIDLNKSYIKLGSTKYNLQAVVGYTVVGSPTITDGVVSGFSGSDYLNILSPKSVPTEIQSNNMKIKMKIKTPQQWSTSNMFLIGYNHSVSSDGATLYDGGLYISTSGRLYVYTTIIDTSPNIILELDTIYYIEIETKGVFKMGISQDNVNWTYVQKDIFRDKWYLRNRNIRIGRAATAAVQEFNGEIFIDETSFVINNKLWFNGQQA